MSKRLLDYRKSPTAQVASAIRGVRDNYDRKRTLQVQGNQSLRLGVLEGYFIMSIPTTINPSVAYIDIESPTSGITMIGNLMYSTFYPVAAGGETPSGVSYQLGDVVGIWPTRMRWDCFLAYDKRDKGSGSFTDPDDIFATVVESNTARITAKLQAFEAWSMPVGATPSLLVFYQIRATFM